MYTNHAIGAICAGSMAKRYGIEEGTRLSEPIFEFFYKNDALHDPLCNEDHIRVLGWASAALARRAYSAWQTLRRIANSQGFIAGPR